VIPAVIATAAVAIWYLGGRWWRLRQTGEYDLRREWKYWIATLAIVVALDVVASGGRLLLLALGPFILIPAGGYLLANAVVLKSRTGKDFRLLGWVTIIAGAMNGIAVVIELWLHP